MIDTSFFFPRNIGDRSVKMASLLGFGEEASLRKTYTSMR
jgi:hypothetical protein